MQDTSEMLVRVQRFIQKSGSPAVMEEGDVLVPMLPFSYTVEDRGGRLWLEVASEDKSVARRILSIDEERPASMVCRIQKFGGVAGKLTILDTRRPQSAAKRVAGSRKNFAEQFRRMLFRQFPGWEIERVSGCMDLEHSLSPVFARGVLRRGDKRIAAMAAPTPDHERELLTFALIWLNYVQAQELALFLPDSAGVLTAHRVRWLDPRRVRVRMFRYNNDGCAGEVDPADLGNLETRVCSPREAMFPKTNGRDEAWLETLVRKEIGVIDPNLKPDKIHGQVLAYAGCDRDIVDLLAVSEQGRLAVLELKASEDMHLPIQALDYWMRIRMHLERGELDHLFPGPAIGRDKPLLRLVAPALSFHSSISTVLRYFSPEIDVERVGLTWNWPTDFRVVLRLQGADLPASHGRNGICADYSESRRLYANSIRNK